MRSVTANSFFKIVPFAVDVTAELIWTLLLHCKERKHGLCLLSKIQNRTVGSPDTQQMVFVYIMHMVQIKAKWHARSLKYHITTQLNFFVSAFLIKTSRAAAYWNHLLAGPTLLFRSMQNQTHINDILIKTRAPLMGWWWERQGHRGESDRATLMPPSPHHWSKKVIDIWLVRIRTSVKDYC